MADELIWEYTPKQFLVLEPGQLASSFYLPPLAGVNVLLEFGYHIFQKAQMVLGSDTPQIMVFIKKAFARRKYFDNPNFVLDIDEVDDKGMEIVRILYNIPLEFHADYHIFASGNYSLMSEGAKEQIRAYSSARYRAQGPNGKLIYDKKLLVLEKSPMLRSFIEHMLDTTIDEDAELLDIPGPDNYWVD